LHRVVALRLRPPPAAVKGTVTASDAVTVPFTAMQLLRTQ
jgi:hypothetical protein